MTGQCIGDMDVLRNGSFKDPSQWWDRRNIKSNFPEFRHKRIQKSLWIKASLVPEQLTRPGIQRQFSGGEWHLRNEKQSMQGKQMHHRAEPGEDQIHIFHDDTAALVALLKACADRKDLCKGSRIHDDIHKSGLLGTNVCIGNVLINMYAKCGAVTKAQAVFDELPARDVFSWGTLIAGYAQLGYGHQALDCFERMQQEGLSPNPVIFTCILKACGLIGATRKGEEIHAEIVRQGLLENNTVLGTAVVDMYAKCGALRKAQKVFDELPVRNIVSWGALIAGYTQHGHGREALKCFTQMEHEGPSPNPVIFISVLRACASIRAAEKGEQIHAEVVKQGLLQNNMVLATALLDMYCKCGSLESAQEMFDKLAFRNVVSWNALIAGYTQHGHGHQALACFEKMQHEGLSPDAVTFTCILKSCGSVGAVQKGEEIHAEVFKQGLLEKDTILANALVDMYGKCGALAKAQEVFDELPVRDAVVWSALMAGYAQLGKVETVINSFNKMIGEGIKPDIVTFTVLLNACSHAGLVDEGQMYFVIMNTRYLITPTLEHHTCMVDLFSRAGHLDKALGVIEKMPTSVSSDYLPLWSSLLGACQKWGNVKFGRLSFEHLVQIDEKNVAAYVCMSNIYAAARMPKEADKVEALRVKNKAWKADGCEYNLLFGY